MLQIAASSAAAVTDAQSEARLLNLGELITSDDYPAIAIDQEQQGTATVRLRVDRNGYVETCKVVESSGSRALDEQTCAVYRARAQFEPARDARGRAQASNYTQRVTWRLEGDPAIPMPRQPWMTRSTLAVTAEGSFVDCKIEATGLSGPPDVCETLMALGKGDDSEPTKREAIASFLISDTYFYPLSAGKAPTPPRLSDANQVGQQVSEVTIDPTGRVSDCKGVRYSGAAGPERDACIMLRSVRFAPASGGASLTATIVLTGYVRTNSVT
ncbi:MAG: TonB family protein [Sphingomonas sp.]|nr:TonB family protein [Sphingomonas sp.]